jgi:hypothetical protein
VRLAVLVAPDLAIPAVGLGLGLFGTTQVAGTWASVWQPSPRRFKSQARPRASGRRSASLPSAIPACTAHTLRRFAIRPRSGRDHHDGRPRRVRPAHGQGQLHQQADGEAGVAPHDRRGQGPGAACLQVSGVFALAARGRGAAAHAPTPAPDWPMVLSRELVSVLNEGMPGGKLAR